MFWFENSEFYVPNCIELMVTHVPIYNKLDYFNKKVTLGAFLTPNRRIYLLKPMFSDHRDKKLKIVLKKLYTLLILLIQIYTY